jgi:hypothetical protein
MVHGGRNDGGAPAASRPRVRLRRLDSLRLDLTSGTSRFSSRTGVIHRAESSVSPTA